MNSTPLRGEITAPGDKSISHRALMIGAIARGTSRLNGLSTCDDVRATKMCLRTLGIVVKESEGNVFVEGTGLQGLESPSGELDCANSGTSMRLLTGLLSGQNFRTQLTGDASLRRRPMGRIFEPLKRMGADFLSNEGRAPFEILGSFPLTPIEYELPVASAQIKSAVLLAGLYADGETRVVEPVLSRDHTERMLGVTTTAVEGRRIHAIQGGIERESFEITIPGDPSAAAFLAAAGCLVPGSDFLIHNVGLNPTRSLVFEKMRGLGADLTVHPSTSKQAEPTGTVGVKASVLKGELRIEGNEVPMLIDEIPILAILCALSRCEFTVRDAAELRKKESDRIGLLVRNLRAIGCETEEYPDGFASRPKNGLFGTRIQTQDDHRIAMSFGVASLVIPEMTIDNPSCVEVSYPGFWRDVKHLTHKID